MKPGTGFVAVRGAAVLALVLALQGCAGYKAYQEGQALVGTGALEAGLAKMEEAVRLEPRNAEFRIGLATWRAMAINRLYAAGEAARRDGRPDEAELAWRYVLRIDPQHTMARQGLEVLATDARNHALVKEAEALFEQGGAAQAGPALDRLRAVLSVDPGHKAAQRLKNRIDEARARQAPSETRLAAAFRKPIGLQFNDAPLRSIFDAISRISGLSFFFDKDVRSDAKGTILARNTTVEDAVRLLLMTNQLEQKVLNDSTLLVYPNTPQKQKEYQSLTVRTFFLANADVKAVSNAIKTIVKTKDLVIDERLGTIIMRDTADAVRVAERIVALQDMSDPEVMLEVEVLEIKRTRLQELGVQWPGQLTLVALSGAGTVAGTTLADLRGLNSSKIQATTSGVTINFNQLSTNANILTNPRIRVRNREKARILIGDRIPVITTTASATSGFISESVSYVEVGLKLEVEPTIYLDDEVAIKVNLEVSNLVREVISRAGTLTYQIGTRGANTVLRLKDGETQILAGLISDEDRATANRIPGLGQVPVAGRLFGTQKDDDQRSEILLSITPRVLRSLRRPDLAAAEFESGTEAAIGMPPLRLSSADGAAVAAPSVAAGVRPGFAASSPPTAVPAAAAAAAAVPLPAPSQRAGQAPGPIAGFASIPAGGSQGAPRLVWQGPTQIRADQSFSVVLRGQGHEAWIGLPLVLSVDPEVLQLIEARPGGFFERGDGSGSLLQQPDAERGVSRFTLSRQPDGEPAGGASTELLVLTFKALKPASSALRLRSAAPEPAGATAAPAVLPPDHVIRVVP